MLTLLFSLSVLTIESLCFGYTAMRFLERFCFKTAFFRSGMRLFNALILGYVLISGIAQIVALKTNLGLKVEIGFALVSLAFGLVVFQDIVCDVIAVYHSIELSAKLCIFLTTLAILIVSLGPTYTIDTYGYHAQTMRWLEDVGTAKGIANIHMRLGYNSSMYVMSALFSFKELFEYPVRVINCFWAMITCGVAVAHIMNFHRHRFHFGDGISIGILWFLCHSWKEWSGICNRQNTALLLLLIALLWIRVCEELEDERAYFFITILIVYATTVKLNVAALGILCVMFLLKLVKGKQIGLGIAWLVINTLTACGWFLRNIFVSGYLIYPLYQIDLFHVDWKVPLEVAIRDSNDIIVYARCGSAYYDLCLTAFRWIPLWIEGMWKEDKLFLISAVLSLTSIVYMLVVFFLGIRKNKSFFLFAICYAALFFYWFFAAPASGFGWGVTLIGTGIIVGSISGRLAGLLKELFLSRIPWKHMVLVSAACALICAALTGYWKGNFRYQADWFNYNYESLDLQDYVKIYYPCDEQSEGKAGYYAFPATNDRATLQHLEARGVYITDGFRTNMNINHFNDLVESF